MQTSPTSPCLDENTVLAFVHGNASAETRAGIERHLASCHACTTLVAMAARAAASHPMSNTEELPRIRSRLAARPRGSTIGRYTILDLVGQGGMGEVYAAYDPELDRRVAVKLLHEEETGAEPAGEGEARGRLLREAKAIARLSHPNVVVVYDAGTADGRVFIAMEFVRGVTLSEWLARQPRSWPEIRDAFVAAGRGLRAAHDAGLVHRDVKPQNIMIGDDGTVRVTDFGLASDAIVDQAASADPALKDSLVLGMRTPDTTLTRTGAWLGTPLYMAPEQFRAQKADARSDQFSFCVALYEAVYGERPFQGVDLGQLRDAVVAGEVRPAPARHKAPAWLRKVLLRGLARRPEDRFPSMQPLLMALAQDPARLRRRTALVAAVAVALLGAGAVAQRWLAAPSAVMCTGGKEKLALVWERPADGGPRPHRDAARRAFLATALPGAAGAWDRVSGALDAYAQQWSNMAKESCLATHVRGEQSQQVLDLRTDCLNSALDDLRATTDLFVKADAKVVKGAQAVTGGLPDLQRCADLRLLRAIVKPPRDPVKRARAEELRRRVAAVRALIDVDKVAEGMRDAPALVDDAVALGFAPVTADALGLLGRAQSALIDYRGAALSLQKAVPAAVLAHDDVKAAEIVANLAGVEGQTFSDEQRIVTWLELGDALLSRTGASGDRARGWLAQGWGVLRVNQGQFGEAARWFERAIEFKRKVGGDSVDTAVSEDGLANDYLAMRDGQRALSASLRAEATYERAGGTDGQMQAQFRSNRGEILNLLGRPAEAIEMFQKAIALFKGAIKEDGLFFSYPLTGLGQSYLRLGKPAAAVAVLERAMQIRDREEPSIANRSETQFALGRALWESGGDRARAVALATKARDGYAKSPGPMASVEVSEVETWLAHHTLGRRRATRGAPGRRAALSGPGLDGIDKKAATGPEHADRPAR